jgi:hypothetical protein
MRTRIVMIGVVLLIIGIGLFVSGAIGLRGSTNTITVFNQSNSGEYVSSEILLNASSSIIVRSPPTVGGLVPAQDITLVTSTNINSYAISSNSSVAGTRAYTSITGNYYYVIFSSTQPNTKLAITNAPLATTAAFGLLSLAGIGFFFIGIILAIAGALLKNKNQRKNSEYEYRYPPAKT